MVSIKIIKIYRIFFLTFLLDLHNQMIIKCDAQFCSYQKSHKFVLQNKHGKISKNITTIKIGPFIFEYLYLICQYLMYLSTLYISEYCTCT